MVRTAKNKSMVYGTKRNDLFIRQGDIIHVDLRHLFINKMVVLRDYYEISGSAERKMPEEYDNCILGYDLSSDLPIYSVKKIVKLIQREGIDYFEAIDLFNQTYGCGNLGANEPIYCMDLDD
jgi:hypothetical protein